MAKHAMTPFQSRYGIRRDELGAQEDVSAMTITMRLRNFGTPYQRRKLPTRYERKYARTLYEIAEERGLHPSTVEAYENKHGNAYYTNPRYARSKHQTIASNAVPHWRDAVMGGKYWGLQCTWLHPEHPDYDQWRSGKLFPDEYVGGSSLTAQQVDAMMRGHKWPRY